MLERNRTFGRVSRPVDKASAPRQTLERQRKSGRAKHAAFVKPKPQAAWPREMPRASAAAPSAIPAVEERVEALSLLPVPPCVVDDVAIEPAEVVETALAVPNGTPEPSDDVPSLVAITAEPETAPVLSMAMDPAARLTPSVSRRPAKRRPILRLAVAASVAVGCLLSFARFSDAHLPAPTIVSLPAPAESAGDRVPAVEPVALVSAVPMTPINGTILPPLLATAAYGTDDLVETAALQPSAAERVTAKAAAMPETADMQAAAAAPRKAAAKSGAPRNAVLPRRREASAQERSRGPILDFLSDLIP